MKPHMAFALLILLFLSSVSCAQDTYTEISAWEPDDPGPIYASFDSSGSYIRDPGILIASSLIGFYQNKISTQSLSRCPFYISCSHYAHLAIKKYGLLIGLAFFIDRNCYRENVACWYHYALRENANGVLKLDDSFYILGETH